MLQYLIILLDNQSTSFCHYDIAKTERRLMPLDNLREGIRFGMMENLMIQFVYPDYELPKAYNDAIESIDHTKIKPTKEGADVLVMNGFSDADALVPVTLRVGKKELLANETKIVELLKKVPRLNVVLTDIETFTEKDFADYKMFLESLSEAVRDLYLDGKTPQLNLLTDRMMLSAMNNCGAGETSITLAPNGKFYVCPAFYYDDDTDNVGGLELGVDIKNKQLYQLDHAPICRHCEAWQCKRCVWLNRKTTLEVNTPSHEQCVLTHLERNASRRLMNDIRRFGSFLPEQGDIEEIDYLDPFDKREDWL